MGKILQFKSCAAGGEFTALNQVTPTSYSYIGMAASTAAVQARIDAIYATDPNMYGKVTAIGYGWQKYVMPSGGKVKFIVRGAAGGTVGSSQSIDPVTGAQSGTGNRGGRGAKISGEMKVKKGDIFYILVGIRGWCNTWLDWGGGGGGASVILRDNPSGAYTFGPLNRKVDIICVAGGGGGASDNAGHRGSHNGKDAAFTNGTSTNGGGSSKARGGAGMTGNGAGGSGGNPAYSILSGSPAYTSMNTSHQGGWGGGGGSYNGGGGGGGYSGGSTNDSIGGYGGTSYLNPSLCVELFRGYATVADDSNRNLTNPWTAYGFVELEVGRAEDKFILAHDADGYKYFNGSDDIRGTHISTGVSDEWELLPDQTNITDATYAMYGARVITNTVGLKSPVRFLVSSPSPDEVISIDGYVAHAVIKMNTDASIADVSSMISLTLTSKLAGTITKMAVSKDQGGTWQTYNGGSWTDIDITDIAEFQSDGYDASFFAAIPLADWEGYKAKNLRFAFCITQNAPLGTDAILSELKYVADLVGSWAHFKEAQASYEYITDDTVEVTFKEAGNYKVNYLDSIT